jgi:hypothetical protein
MNRLQNAAASVICNILYKKHDNLSCFLYRIIFHTTMDENIVGDTYE